ncbi:PKD domain-containing protein [Psychroserpens luteus]|uniref:PKD domain-containing protein n=1 Tax=Psychroserpens luteus TaxID=1434066 RepID=A0ABW5ZVY0_9FLAO|nr:PKD domain-containing protein [Psychroserpens luteus]
MKNKINIFRRVAILSLCLISGIVFNSCESAYEFDLPESNSQIDTVLPTADFSYIPDANDFTTIEFTDLSFQSTTYLWDFGGGVTSSLQDPTHTFAGEGTYPVSLTASDANGASDTVTIDVIVVDVFVAITPDVLNGDFTGGQSDWGFSSFTGGTTSPYNSSSDGSWINYDGSDNGSKTPGAKWTMSTSGGVYLSSNTRYAYQEIIVSPNTDYVLEYVYAIKTEEEQSGVADGGNRIIGGIIDGHFDDGADGIASYNSGALVSFAGDMNLGKTVFTTVELPFTSNASGEVAILIYGVTDVDAYVDNVKVYPVE